MERIERHKRHSRQIEESTEDFGVYLVELAVEFLVEAPFTIFKR